MVAAALAGLLISGSCGKPGGQSVDEKVDMTPVEFSVAHIFGQELCDSIAVTIKEKAAKAHAAHDYIDEAEQTNRLFWLYYDNRNYQQALKYAKNINFIGDSVNNPYIQGRALHNLALVSSGMKNPSISDRNFTYTLEKYMMLKDSSGS